MRLIGFLSSGIFTCALVSLGSGAFMGCAADPGDEPVDQSDSHLTSSMSGRQLQASEVANLVRQAGFPEAVVSKMVCTAYYESHFYDHSINHDSNGTTDHGIFQVNSIHIHDRGCPPTTEGLYDPTANANCAFLIYKADLAKGQGHDGVTAPWAAYRGHKPECDQPASPSSPWNFSGSAGPTGTPAPGGAAAPAPTTAATTAGTCNRSGAFYCGNPASNLKGDPNSLYHCESGRMVLAQACTSGCNVSAQGTDDFCSADPNAAVNTPNQGTATDFGAGLCAPVDGACLGPGDTCCADAFGIPQTCTQDLVDPTQFFCSSF
jgi:hypothetical protein